MINLLPLPLHYPILLPQAKLSLVKPYSIAACAASDQAITKPGIGRASKEEKKKQSYLSGSGTLIALYNWLERPENIIDRVDDLCHANLTGLNCPPSKEYWIAACLSNGTRFCVEKKLLDDFLMIRDKRFKKRCTIIWVEKSMESL